MYVSMPHSFVTTQLKYAVHASFEKHKKGSEWKLHEKCLYSIIICISKSTQLLSTILKGITFSWSVATISVFFYIKFMVQERVLVFIFFNIVEKGLLNFMLLFRIPKYLCHRNGVSTLVLKIRKSINGIYWV